MHREAAKFLSRDSCGRGAVMDKAEQSPWKHLLSRKWQASPPDTAAPGGTGEAQPGHLEETARAALAAPA